MLKFSIKNVFRKKTVAILSSLGIGIGLMLMFVLGSFTTGVQVQFAENFSKLQGQVLIVGRGATPLLPINTTQILQNSEIGSKIQAFNVQYRFPSYFTDDYNGEFREASNEDVLSIAGINASLDSAFDGATTKLIDGRIYIEGENEIILDDRLLTTPNLNFSLGSIITLDSGIPTGVINLTVVGIFSQEESGAPDFIPKTYFGYTSLETVWRFLGDIGFENNSYTSIDLQFQVANNDETNEYVNFINDLSESNGFGNYKIAATSLAQFQDALEETFSLFDTFTTVISAITALVGGLTIIVTQLNSVSARKKEFAILKATGWKNSHIFRNVIYESLLLGTLGAIIGLSLGSLLIYFFSGGISTFGNLKAVATPALFAEVIGFALILGVFGGLYPGYKATRVRPVVVLKGE